MPVFWFFARLGMASPSSRSLPAAFRDPRVGPPPVRPLRDGLVVLALFTFFLVVVFVSVFLFLLLLPHVVWLDVFFPFRCYFVFVLLAPVWDSSSSSSSFGCVCGVTEYPVTTVFCTGGCRGPVRSASNEDAALVL